MFHRSIRALATRWYRECVSWSFTRRGVATYGERGDLGHGGVAPHGDLVLRVAVRRYQFVDGDGPHEVAHLRAGVYGLHGLVVEHVPEPDVPIRRSSARRQQTALHVVCGVCVSCVSCLSYVVCRVGRVCVVLECS